MKLFEEMNIGKMTIKNRIVMAPMGTTSDGDGGYSVRTIRYFTERAKGGTGMIITGRNASTTRYEEYSCSLLDNHHHINRLSVLAEQVHQYGTKLCVQIGPGVGRMVFTDPFTPPYSASEVQSFWFPNLKCRQLGLDDIRFIVEKVGYSASLAQKADADAVEIHAYGGYLADQFMSKLWNTRTDEYGGDLMGRMKFILEIINSVRQFCGNNFPVIVKYTPLHDIPGGRELSEGIEMAKIFEDAGVDALHVDMGCYDTWYKAIPTVYQEEGCQIELAAEIKKHVSIPVLAQGKLFNPAFAERLLQENKTDFILLGHQMLADPHWANKVKMGHTYDIVPCIGCNECLLSGHKGKNYICAVNPLCHHEDDYPLHLATEKKSVLVIGGGPGGMEAAIAATERGFDVQLWERSSKLGGTLLAAGAPTFKKDVMRYVDYLVNKVHRFNVDIRLNKDSTVEEIISGCFDKVILATGSIPLMPPIPGIEKGNVKTSTDVLLGITEVIGSVVVIGGGLVGCEAALYCKQIADDVTIIEMLDDILVTADHCANNDQKLRAMIRQENIGVIAKARVVSIDAESITYEQGEKESVISCNTVVIAAGYKSNNELAQALKGKVKDISVIGDASKPGKIITAVHEGYHAIRMM